VPLPVAPDAASFDALHDDPPAWRGEIEALAAEHGCPGAEVRQAGDGTVLVALLARDRVLKLFPPFLRDHFEFECEMLRRLHGRLGVPTPELLHTGEREGWPYLLETQLHGEQLDRAWPALDEAGKLALLGAIGRLIVQAHAVPLGDTLPRLAPRWGDFIAGQRARCAERQRRTGLPAHLLAQLEAFLDDGPLPEGPDVGLTGEYSPWNLFVDPAQPSRLAAMFDFGDGLVGPREYDLLGPLCFFAAGHPARVRAFTAASGSGLPSAPRRESLLRLMLLHRYSNLKVQLACEGWQQEPSFPALAARLWRCD
jgi:hygromycin-B 7''-O-kinase